MKKVLVFFLVFALSISLQGCLLKGREEMLNNQMSSRTTWRSEDGKIQFTMQAVVTKEVHSDGKEFMVQNTRGVGTMETNNGCISIWICDSWDYDSNESGYGEFIIQLAPEDEYLPKITLESGLRGPLEDGKVTVTFTSTTYLVENTVITFYCVDK